MAATKKVKKKQQNVGNRIFLSIFAVAKASLAQLVEHDTLNVGVQGSNP